MDLRQQILNADDIKKERGVEIPEWNATVEVWGMTAAQRARAVKAARDEDGEVDSGILAVCVMIETVRDATSGKLMFGPADRDPLLAKSGDVVDRVATIGLRLSGMTADAKEAIRKNSETASGDSTSDSPKPSA